MMEYFMIVTREMWDKCPELATNHFESMLSRHYPESTFTIETRYENNILGTSTTVALLAKEVENDSSVHNS
jgi:hypothetical protein